MFSQVSVCSWGRGVGFWSGGGRCLALGKGELDPPPEMATAAVCTHPTGMHYCSFMFLHGDVEVMTYLPRDVRMLAEINVVL